MSVPSPVRPDVPERLRQWLAVPYARLPSVTSTGDEVLYVSNASGIPLAWSVGTRGGTPRPFTLNGERVGRVLASPKGRRAVVASDKRGDEHWQLTLLDWGRTKRDATPTALVPEPLVIHQPGPWRDDGRHYVFSSNARDRRFFDIHELDVERPYVVRSLLVGDGTHEALSARGNRLLAARANTNLDVDLFLFEGERRVHLNRHGAEQTVYSAAIGADAVYAASNPGRELAALVRYRFGGSGHEFLREYGAEVEEVRPSPVGTSIALSVNRAGWSEVHLFDPATGEDRVFNSGPKGVVTSLSWFPDGTAFVYALASVEGESIYRRDIATGKERRLVGPTTTPEPVTPPTLRRFTASDRLFVPYWEYVPRTEPQATIVWVHGGPESQSRPGYSPVLAFLVGRGYRVIAPNVRGSLGYGRTFVHLDDVRRRMDSVRDLRELAEHLVATGKAVRGKIGIVGGSYGGFMVLAAATEYPDLWGAAVDIVGIANLVTFLERTGPWRRALREAEYGRLDTDRKFLESISPLHRAARITAPLLVIHGRNDPRVPIHEAEQIVSTLRALHRPVDFLVFHNEGHGIVRRENREAAWTRIIEWFDRYLGPGSEVAPEPPLDKSGISPDPSH